MSLTATTLEPELSSPGAARSFVRGLLPEGFVERDACLLLTSELVTNAVLHAGTALVVRARCRPAWLRIEVEDASPVRPVRRNYGVKGSTGRGLGLVDHLSSSWGVDHHGSSKTVWFEIGDRPADLAAAPRRHPIVDAPHRIRFEQAPIHLLPATLEYGEAVLREVALMALSGGLLDRLPHGWRVPALDVGPVLEALAGVVGHETPPVLEVDLPRGAAVAALDRLALVGLGDELAEARRILLPPPLPEVGLCRYWFLTEIASQAGGAAPVPWHRPELGEPPRHPVHAGGAVLEISTGTEPTVVADDANRIVHANDSALELLRWDATLIGQRLTAIIPPEHRELHLAGFARLGLTGTPRIIGTPTTVYALRRDGLRVEVQLVLDVLATGGGRNLYRGELRTGAPAPRARQPR